MLMTVKSKLAEVEELVDIKKNEPSCDEACKKGCDAEADKMIRELKNPLHDITWNCKNNYDTYTTDYDPNNSHFDRISGDVMDVQRILNQIQNLEKKIKTPWNPSLVDERDTDAVVLRELKKEMGLPEDQPAPSIASLDVSKAIHEAVDAHAANPRSPGFIKAHGLEN